MAENTGSVLHPVKRSIVDWARNHPGIGGDGWEVTYGWPGDTFEDKAMWLGAANVSRDHETIRAGRRRRHETIDLTVALWSVDVEGDDAAERQEAADQAALAVVKIIDEWIADENHLGRPDLIDWALLTSFTHEVGPSENGQAALIDLTIRIRSRLL